MQLYTMGEVLALCFVLKIDSQLVCGTVHMHTLNQLASVHDLYIGLCMCVYRLIQYGSRFVSWALEVEGLSPELIQKLRSLESSISTARKRQ